MKTLFGARFRAHVDPRLVPCESSAREASTERSTMTNREPLRSEPRPLEHPLPAGMRDLLPEEAERRRALSGALLAAFERHGYRAVVPPAFEFADVLERGLGALHSEDVLRFIEPESGEVAAFRPDMTPQIARIVATRLLARPAPHRLAYEGTVLRRRVGRARKHRQIPQVGVELAGLGGLEGDLEVLELACDAMRGVGLSDFTLDLGHAGIARPLVDALPLGLRVRATAALAAKDADALAQLDDGGALAALAIAGTDRSSLDEALRTASHPDVRASLEELARIFDAAQARAFAPRLTLDLGEVRGFAYYTGMIFRLYARGPGESLGGGGRYDELMGRFGAPMPAVGFGVDLDALAVAVDSAYVRAARGKARVLVSGGDARARVLELRAAGISAAIHADEASALDHARAWGYALVVVGQNVVVVETGESAPYSLAHFASPEGA